MRRNVGKMKKRLRIKILGKKEREIILNGVKKKRERYENSNKCNWERLR